MCLVPWGCRINRAFPQNVSIWELNLIKPILLQKWGWFTTHIHHHPSPPSLPVSISASSAPNTYFLSCWRFYPINTWYMGLWTMNTQTRVFGHFDLVQIKWIVWKVDNAICRINQRRLVLLTGLAPWRVIYSVESLIQPLDNHTCLKAGMVCTIISGLEFTTHAPKWACRLNFVITVST